jgi:YVTN family beta-propeller protein
MKVLGLGRFVACFVLFGSLAVAKSPKADYHLLKTIPLGASADGGREYFDYIVVDAPTRRVYVSHGTEFKVVDADTGDVVGNILYGLKTVHGIALVKELGKGFISDGGANRAVIVDLETLKGTGEVKTGAGADSILYDPASKRVFSFNGHGKDVTAIDPANGTVVGTIPVGGTPEQPVADGKGMIYDNNEDTSEVMAIDSHALTIKARWPIAPAGAPTAIAMDRQHRRLFTSGRNPQQLVVMDADNGKVIQSFPITSGVDANIYEPETGLLFVSTREGMIHIFHEDSPDKFSVVGTVKTELGAKTMALDPKTHNLYLTTSDFGPPPAPTAEQPHPNQVAIPGTFRLLIYGR